MSHLYDRVEVCDFLDSVGADYRPTSGSRGPQYNIRECPKCGNDKWKVYVSQDKGFGNCFVCEAAYNLWTLGEAFWGDDRRNVMEKFKEIEHGRYRPIKKEPRIIAPVFDGDLELPFSVPLPTRSGKNLKYLEDRGVTAEMAKYFHLRYCEDDWWEYNKEDGERGAINFGKRVIIPVYDLEGNLVTFQGRDITGEADRKYMFPPRLPSTARFIYNGHNVIANRAREAAMGEGAFDVFGLKRAFDSVKDLNHIVSIGSFGMHLSKKGDGEEEADQLGALIKMRNAGLRKLTIFWDGEPKALKRAVKAASDIDGIGISCYIAMLPKETDPGSCTNIQIITAYQKAVKYSKINGLKLLAKKPYG